MAIVLDGLSAVLLLLSLVVVVQTMRLHREKQQVRAQTRALVIKALDDLESGDAGVVLEACQIIGMFAANQEDDLRRRVNEALARLSMSDDPLVARQANVAFGRAMTGA